MDRDDFIYKLIDMQYDRNDYELERGTFRVRGDVLDDFSGGGDGQGGAHRVLRGRD